MITVTYEGKEFICATAYKGSNYIKLLDEAGCKVADFEGVVDFSLFTIDGGEWQEEPACEYCHIPVVLPDGSFAVSGHTCGRTPQVFYGSVDIDFEYGSTAPNSISGYIGPEIIQGGYIPPEQEIPDGDSGDNTSGDDFPDDVVYDNLSGWFYTFILPEEVRNAVSSGMNAFVTLVNPHISAQNILSVAWSKEHTFSVYASQYFSGAFIHYDYDDDNMVCTLTFRDNILAAYAVVDLDGTLITEYTAHYMITCVPSSKNNSIT